jgi:hypothetical protein
MLHTLPPPLLAFASPPLKFWVGNQSKWSLFVQLYACCQGRPSRAEEKGTRVKFDEKRDSQALGHIISSRVAESSNGLSRIRVFPLEGRDLRFLCRSVSVCAGLCRSVPVCVGLHGSCHHCKSFRMPTWNNCTHVYFDITKGT